MLGNCQQGFEGVYTATTCPAGKPVSYPEPPVKSEGHWHQQECSGGHARPRTQPFFTVNSFCLKLLTWSRVSVVVES